MAGTGCTFRAMKNGRIVAFIVSCLLAAAWAFFLIGKHYEAEAQLLTPGLLCGADGGCGAVLGSDYSTIAGIPVSAPAVPLYAMLALFGVMALRGKLEEQKVAAIGVISGLAGLGFGLFLVWAMVVQIGEICRYCLVMDALNVAVLVTAAALHPDGFAAAFTKLKDSAGVLFEAVPGLTLGAVVLGGTLIVHLATMGQAGMTPAPVDPTPSVEAATPPPKTVTSPTPAPPKANAVQGGQRPAPGTRRVVLTEDVKEIALDDSVPRKGNTNAPVTIVVFEDFQCPFCKKLSGNLEVLLETVPDKVSLAFMHYPMQQKCNANELKKSMHRNACSAAAASVCAQEQGRFWEMHDVLFRNNNKLGGRALVRYAEEIGLDVDRWKTCFSAASTLAKIKKDSEIGGAAGVSGTPSFFLNGRKLVGAQPVEALMASVDALLEGPDGRVLLDVELGGEVTGLVDAQASQIELEGRKGRFTIDAFEASLDKGTARSEPGVEPARGVTWYEADAACKKAGKRLCTEEEWLTACTGAIPVDENGDGIFSKDTLLGRQHVYGEHYRDGWCADGRKKAEDAGLLTGNYPNCGTPEGVYDLEGLMKEWVGTTPDKAALKGGSYFSGASARCAYFKDDQAPDSSDSSIGFRCCSGGGDAPVSDKHPGGKVGDTILSWELPRQGGGTLKNDSLKGKPYIMTFWASWCAPCKKELPALAELYQQLSGEGLEIIGVNVDRNKSAADAYLASNPLPFPIVYDTDNSTMDRFDTRGVPTTFWVQKDGAIRQRSIGYDEKGKTKLHSDARELLSR